MAIRRRLFIYNDSMGDEIRDAAAPDEPGCLIRSDGSVSAVSLVELLNRIISAPEGDLRCGGSGAVNRSGVKGSAACPNCGQVFQPPHVQDGPWRPWVFPKHNQPG